MTNDERKAIVDFMRTANAALAKVTKANDTLMAHLDTCWICKNRFFRSFVHCHDRAVLTVNYLMEGVIATPYANAIEQLKQQAPDIYKQAERLVQQDAADVDWLEKLASLEDKREKA